MSDENQTEAQELAKRAGAQGKNAAKNTARAMKAAAEPAAVSAVAEAKETGAKLEGTAQDAVRAARRMDVGVLGRLSSDTGVGFLALSVAIYSGTIAYTKFRQVARGGSAVMRG